MVTAEIAVTLAVCAAVVGAIVGFTAGGTSGYADGYAACRRAASAQVVGPPSTECIQRDRADIYAPCRRWKLKDNVRS